MVARNQSPAKPHPRAQAYADTFDESQNRYIALRPLSVESVVADGRSVVVNPDAANKHIAAAAEGDTPTGWGGAVARWGLVPPWAIDEKIGNRHINARADTAATKPAYRSAFKRRRCLVPVSEFYEWQIVKGSKAKQP